MNVVDSHTNLDWESSFLTWKVQTLKFKLKYFSTIKKCNFNAIVCILSFVLYK
jgi:hypothetical protein